MATQDTKSGPSEKGSYQAPTTSIFLSEMPSFQAGTSKVFKASLPLGRNSNFFGQSGFGIKSRFIDNAKKGFGKSKEKVTPLTSNDDFEKAGPFKRSHYINISDIYKL